MSTTISLTRDEQHFITEYIKDRQIKIDSRLKLKKQIFNTVTIGYEQLNLLSEKFVLTNGYSKEIIEMNDSVSRNEAGELKFLAKEKQPKPLEYKFQTAAIKYIDGNYEISIEVYEKYNPNYNDNYNFFTFSSYAFGNSRKVKAETCLKLCKEYIERLTKKDTELNNKKVAMEVTYNYIKAFFGDKQQNHVVIAIS